MSIDELTPEQELRELGIEAMESVIDLLDVMAGDPPDGFDIEEQRQQTKKRSKRAGELLLMILNRDAILASNDLPKELVTVPEWGGDVYVRGLTGKERDAFEAGMIEQRGRSQTVNLQNIRAKLASMSICDESGKRIFTDADMAQLSGKSAVALQRVFEVARRLSGLGDGDVEELTKGLEENPLEGSPSGLPSD